MDPDNLIELVALYGRLSFELGQTVYAFVYDSTPVDGVLAQDKINGLNLVLKRVYDAILSYSDVQVDELDLTERLLDRPRETD